MGEPNRQNSNTEPEIITGVVERIVYRDEETGYTVCAIQPARRGPEVIVAGTCAAIWVGELLRAEGRWTEHPKHGRQFAAERITSTEPVSAEGIERYLGSGIIKGVGKKMAARLVRRFGVDTLRIIEKESARLLEVPGLGAMRREEIRRAWAEQKAVRDIMIFLQSHSVGPAMAHRIYKRYGDQAVALVQDNPYRLCRDIWGIGFKTADRIAQSLGIPRDSPYRALAGVEYVLQMLEEEGHCFATREALREEAERLLEIPASVLEQAISDALMSGRLMDDGGKIYRTDLYAAEVAVADKLLRLLSTPLSVPLTNWNGMLQEIALRLAIRFSPDQQAALDTVFRSKLSILTGGPGVGKTTIVKALTEVYKAQRLKVLLAAPTGRAAKRLEEATGSRAQTIHRLLGYNPTRKGFEHDAHHPLVADALILDECSMIDLPLMDALLAAVPERARVVFVGDVDQLPSIGPGNLLRDMIDSRVIPCCRLHTIYRQSEKSRIILNAHRVNQGLSLVLPPRDKEAPLSDFYFISQESPDEILRTVLSLVTERIPSRFRLDPKTDVQVLTPMRKNELGSENLNRLLQEALNPKGLSLERGGRIFRVGDRVLQICNNYGKGAFNGDIGLIHSLDPETVRLTVQFDSGPVEYDAHELDELELAYACSIHKSQGSEYPAVVIVLATQHFKLLQRNLLYTAITRGKKLVCLVGSLKAVYIAIRNNRLIERQTGLKERLIAGRLAGNTALSGKG